MKKGKLELADGGTLLLDEIGTMPLNLQAKLLRVLEERQFERLGGVHAIQVDFRLLAATNAELEAAVEQGSFRMDLFHRLKVVSLRMPPLRDRREDIGLLAEHFAREFARNEGRPRAGFSPEAVWAMENYHWPGNVRELRNAVEHAVVMGERDLIGVNDLPETVFRHAPDPAPCLKDAAGEARRESIRRAFIQASGCYADAARLLGTNPTYFSRMVHKLNMKAELESIAQSRFRAARNGA
jgi:DNA-binding NtrC family response regulator